MKPTLQALRRSTRPGRAAIERFLAAHSFPLVAPGRVTFVFHGTADAVRLQHWLFGLPGGLAFERLGATDLWFLELDLPDGSRVEYKFEVVRGDDRPWILDPLNPHHAHDPHGANSVCWAHGYAPPAWLDEHPATRHGEIEAIRVPVSDDDPRDVKVYLPPRFRRRRSYPLLVIHDGGDFMRFGDLRRALDNLTHLLDLPELVVALHEPQARNEEYVASPQHARFVSVDLPRALERELSISDSPAERGLLGASLGAVASLHAAWTYPGHWGRLALLSGSFAFSDLGMHSRGPLFDPVVEFLNAFRSRPGHVAEQIFMACGIYESLIYENRSLVPLLQAQGIDVRYREARDGHNWQNWRDRLREGLGWLYPGPAWLVYD